MTCTKFFRTHLASPASFNVVSFNVVQLECHNNALGDITHSVLRLLMWCLLMWCNSNATIMLLVT